MMKQVYLIASLDAKWVTQEREKLISRLVPEEMRDENLLELIPGNSSHGLKDVLGEILGELSMIPFLPDSRRVVVAHELNDLLAGGGRRGGKKTAQGKKSPLEAFKRFVEQDLSATENVLILSCIPDPARGQYLDEKGALYKFLQNCSCAEILRPPYRETDPIFLFGDAMLQRDTLKCLTQFRALYSDNTRSRIFREMLNNVRFLIQAKTLRKLKEKGARVLDLYMPDDNSINLQKQHAFKVKKYEQNAGRFQLAELMRALDKLLEINRFLFPSPNMRYIPDMEFVFETFIVEFCEGAKPRPRSR